MTGRLELELSVLKTLKELATASDLPLDCMDAMITLGKITGEQLADIIGFIAWCNKSEQESGYTLANIGHDLAGFKDEILSGPCGFAPRTADYATA